MRSPSPPCAVIALLLAAGGSLQAQNEPYRPQYHFTPRVNWMNDPNGLVYYEGEYHLFFQHNPSGNGWGNMSWGHAVSRDLVRWEELPVAIPTENGIAIFSGSAVVDWNNTSGFGVNGKPPLVAIYTGAHSVQDQRIAYSNDRGRTWTNYAGNPVINLGLGDFRDPKVFWHASTQKWVVAVALPSDRKVRLYGSPDLKSWTQLSDFGPSGSTNGAWECPDLFQVKIAGENASKWVMTVNCGGGAPMGGSGTQYFVGDFDGTTFTWDLANPAGAELPEGTVVADFESGTYAGWTRTGTAFGTAPATGTLANQQAVTGFLGSRLVNSFAGGDGSTGKLTSGAFPLTKRYLNFLIGGGSHAGQTCVNLKVNGSIVRTATGDDNERLNWKHWDVAEFAGASAVLEIVDTATGGWGHINADHFLLADSAVPPSGDPALWMDHGPDNYAGVTWSDIPASDGRKLWIGWMVDLRYGGSVPTSPWRSGMTLPRELVLRRMADGLKIAANPVEELKSCRGAQIHYAGGTLAEANAWLAGQQIPRLMECEVELEAPEDQLATIRVGNETEKTLLTWDRNAATLTLDRTQSGNVSFNDSFPGSYPAPVLTAGNRLKLRLFVDTASLEVFSADGTTVLTSLIFPGASTKGLAFSGGEGVKVVSLDLWEMSSALPAAPAAATLLGQWQFNETAAGSYADSSGNGNAMVADSSRPAPTVVQGREGNGVEIRKVANQGSALKVAAAPPLTPASFTASYFFNPKANNNAKLPQIRWDGSNGLAWGFEILGDRKMNFYVFDAVTANDVQSAALLPFEAFDGQNGTGDDLDNDPAWHHVAATYDASSGKLTLYLDGVKSEKTVTGLSGAPRYGAYGRGGIQSGDGLTIYDDLRLYAGVLSDAQIAWLRANPGQPLPPADSGGGEEEAAVKPSLFRAGSSTFVDWGRPGPKLYRSEDLLQWEEVPGSENLRMYSSVTGWRPQMFFRLEE